jgi:pimeloyl-ACP methyl ester carboxylesterase
MRDMSSADPPGNDAGCGIGTANTALLRLHDGRTVGCETYGDPNGQPVLMLHGTPGSRLMFGPADAAAQRLGLRLICPDRPGIGMSSWHAARTLHTVAADMVEVVGQLEAERIAVFGVSGGAPYAVATALRLGDRVHRLALVSPMGPIADLGGDLPLSVQDRALFHGVARRPALARALVRTLMLQFRVAPRSLSGLLGRLLGEPDRSILTRPALVAHVITDIGEAIRQGPEGIVRDLELLARPWSCDLLQVDVATVLWQGERDRLVPKEAAFELGRRLAQAETIRLPEAGHFWIYDNIEAVLYRLVQPEP